MVHFAKIVNGFIANSIDCFLYHANKTVDYRVYRVLNMPLYYVSLGGGI